MRSFVTRSPPPFLRLRLPAWVFLSYLNLIFDSPVCLCKFAFSCLTWVFDSASMMSVLPVNMCTVNLIAQISTLQWNNFFALDDLWTKQSVTCEAPDSFLPALLVFTGGDKVRLKLCETDVRPTAFVDLWALDISTQMLGDNSEPSYFKAEFTWQQHWRTTISVADSSRRCRLKYAYPFLLIIVSLTLSEWRGQSVDPK